MNSEKQVILCKITLFILSVLDSRVRGNDIRFGRVFLLGGRLWASGGWNWRSFGPLFVHDESDLGSFIWSRLVWNSH